MLHVQDRADRAGEDRVAVELARDVPDDVEAHGDIFGLDDGHILRQPVGDGLGHVLRGDGRVDLDQADLAQGADARIGPAGPADPGPGTQEALARLP